VRQKTPKTPEAVGRTHRVRLDAAVSRGVRGLGSLCLKERGPGWRVPAPLPPFANPGLFWRYSTQRSVDMECRALLTHWIDANQAVGVTYVADVAEARVAVCVLLTRDPAGSGFGFADHARDFVRDTLVVRITSSTGEDLTRSEVGLEAGEADTGARGRLGIDGVIQSVPTLVWAKAGFLYIEPTRLGSGTSLVGRKRRRGLFDHADIPEFTLKQFLSRAFVRQWRAPTG